MSEDAKAIVAAQLTLAFFVAAGGQIGAFDRTEEAVVAKYHEMLRRLDESEPSPSEFTGVLPETG